MTTTKRIAKIEQSLKLQHRTLKNLEAMKLTDAGATIELTKRIIANLEAHKKLLSA